MATLEQIESFRDFASEQVRKGARTLSMADLFDLWEIHNLPEDQQAENIAAIHASLADMQRGETGRDATEILREMREQLSLSGRA